MFGRVPSLPHHEAVQLIGSEIFGRLNTTFALPGAQAAVAQFRPDLVVHESAEVAVRLAAEAAGARSVAVNPSLTIPEFATSIASGVAPLRDGLGLPAVDDDWLLLCDTLSWFPEVFDLPAPSGLRTHRYRDVREATPTPLPDRELVYVTLGSEAAQLPFFPPVIRACVAGALASGLPVVVATGRPVDPEVLGGLEGDLTVHTWVDQDELLERARVVVCHAGAGTTLGALRAGVPIVAVPLFADQPNNAGQLVATGTGVQVAPGPTLEAHVAAAVRELAETEPTASLAMAAEIAALPPIDDALPWLEAG